MPWTQVCCRYDGTFSGFLSCVFDSYVNRETPAEFLLADDLRLSLYPERTIAAHDGHARRVYRSLAEKCGGEGRRLVTHGFLTCMEDKELWLWRFIREGYRRGPAVCRDLTHPVVDRVRKGVWHLEHEAHQYTGFVRFSELDGALVGEIEPKNRVLPLLQPHFCGRYPQEKLVLYDRTHKEALLHQPGRWAILPADNFRMGPAGAEELAYRRLWRTFYDTIAIEGRYNPKCRMTHMPKRYWAMMTEFQEDGAESRRALPPQP